jgi:acetyl esterase/lipase
MDHEGHKIAEWLNSLGIAGFILEYRHRNSGAGYGHPAPLLDAQRAVRMVRSRVDEYGIDPNRIGILGFSAGGHLASTAATHFDKGKADAKDPIERVSCRPDFAVLLYPVISLTESFTHQGSKRNLLGNNPDAKLVKSLSNEKQVTPETPPTFLMHTYEDRGVPAENSIYFYLALRKAKVPAEMHIYLKGRHGIGLGKTAGAASSWPLRCAEWMQASGFLDKNSR